MFKKGNSYSGKREQRKLNKGEMICRIHRFKREMKREAKCECGIMLIKRFVEIGSCSRCARKRGLV